MLVPESPPGMSPLFRPLLASALITLAAVGAGASAARAQDLRFSVTLGAEERAAAGLTKLTSDQVAVIDAFVRRDTASRSSNSTPVAPEKANATFSERLTAQERQTAGLGGLTAQEIRRLDGFVDQQQSARLARTLLAPPTYISRSARVKPTEKKAEREIHGSFSLSYGMGSGGYSEKTGAMMLSMEDPDRHYAIAIGYTESHVKGGNYIYRDPLYDRSLTPEDPLRR
jgi:hypothetical protein